MFGMWPGCCARWACCPSFRPAPSSTPLVTRKERFLMASPSLSQTAGTARATAQAGAVSFEKFAGWCALAAGGSGFLYSIAFIILKDAGISAFFLMLGGLLATPVLLAVYERLRETDASFARWGLLLGLAAAIGSLIHGGYDLANAINPP